MRGTIDLERIAEEVGESVRRDLESVHDTSEQVLREFVLRRVSAEGKERGWSSDERVVVADRVMASFRGLDILEPLLADPEVTEIMVNGPDDVFYEKGGRLYRFPYRFASRERLEDVIQSIVAKVNRTVNEAMPIVDARLADGSRVNAVLPPVSLRGPALTIRKFPETLITMEKLQEWGALSGEAAQFLAASVAAKKNIFISGGTGAGKTTLLNAMSMFIPNEERIVVIEDSAELRWMPEVNVVQLETRQPNAEGKGEITIRQLLRAALRMRPNRIIVGEVRGAEAIDMLQAMNTGHEGSLSTGHANSVRDMLYRLETMALAGSELPPEAIRRQIVSALHLLVHVARTSDFKRKVTEIAALEGWRDGDYVLKPIFAWKARPDGSGSLEAVSGSAEEGSNR